MPFFKNHIPSGHRPAVEEKKGGAHSGDRGSSARDNTTTRDETHADAHTQHAHADVRDPRSTKGQLIRSLVRRGTRKAHDISDAYKRGHGNDDKVAAGGGTAPKAKDKKKQNAAGELSTEVSVQSDNVSSPPSSLTIGTVISPRGSVRSDVNSNKPLPSPPPPGTADEADGQPKKPKPIFKLNRIMATLSDAEIEKLFSGAPQFFARSQGQGTGAPHPSVAFPWDEELIIRDLTDHTQIENDAWGSITASPRIILRDPISATSPTGRKRPHFNARCHERPNMLSMQGLEKGTLGYQAALELSVADTLLEGQYGFDSLGSKSQVIVEQRQKLITSQDGLRHLDDAAVMEQLLRVEQRYHAGLDGLRMKSKDLYNELFLKVLHPPTRVIDHNDPYSLAVQIHALVKVLAAYNSWIDFSRVEWRIRLGQILWGFPLDDELEDGSAINDGADTEARSEERYWLLLQILLACELLIRLDAITEGEEYGTQRLKASEVHRFEKEANASVKWSLLLARAWLENITIIKTKAAPEEPPSPKGWLTALTTKMHLRHEHMIGSYHTDHTQYRHNTQAEHVYSIKGKYNERQVFGLTQFARKLRWPDVEAYVFRVNDQAPDLSKPTPINSSCQVSDRRRSTYFDDRRQYIDSRKVPGRRRKLGAALHASGWLSKSYIAGLLLPGEALSHYLMASLVENDPEAMERLGPLASLCGGFMYKGKSFWSTACIVGRVLAAGRGSVECMGWISSDVIPSGHDEGWVDIDVKNINEELAKTGKKARLWGKTVVERESDVLGDADPSNILPADFIIPYENQYYEPPPSNIRIELDSLNLYAPIESIDTTSSSSIYKMRSPVSFSDDKKPPEIRTYPASMTFTMTHDGIEQPQEFNFALSRDVYFVTAHPCAPSSRVKLFKSPTSPTIQQIDIGGNDQSGKPASPAHISGHPLHKYFTYSAIHLVDLLNQPDASLEDLLKRGAAMNRSSNSLPSAVPAREPRVLVIDCITGFAPPRSPELQELSRVSSLSSSFAYEPTGAPLVQVPSPGMNSAEMHRRRPSTAASISSRIDINNNNNNSNNSSNSTSANNRFRNSVNFSTIESKMNLGTRRRRFGSDMEVLARALCAERGWSALISRRRRGCLACAIREAGALAWKVVIRVE